MNYRKIAYFLLFGLMVTSCATTKNKLISSAVISQPKETLLSEDEQNEFEYLFIEGIKQKQLGNLSSAVSFFSRCLEIDPYSAVSMYEMANLHYVNNDLTSAVLLLEKANSIVTNNKWYKMLLAQIYQQRKQYSEASLLYNELCIMEPENQEFLYSKAVLMSMAGQYQEAIDAYNLLESEIGINEQISVAKQQVYISMGKPEKAFEEINLLIASDPDNPEYYGLLAEYYQMQGDNENALKYFEKILQIDPENGIVHFSLASYYTEEGNILKAFDHIKKAYKNDELDADTKIQYYLMQTADSENSLWTNAQIEELLDILYEKYPDDNRMLTMYAEYFIRQNQLDKARDNLRKFLETDKSTYIIWQQLLYIENDLQDYNSLYTESKEAIEYFPNQAALYAWNAVSALQIEKYEEALEILEEGESYIVDNQPLQIQFTTYKGEANYKLNRIEQAFKAFDEVLKINPDNYMVLNNYAYYLSIRGENLEKAERLSNQVVKANPDNPTYLDTYAWVLFMREEYSLAKFYMETAIENGGDENSVLIEHYGDILFMLGEKVKAMENWKKAKELGDESEVLNQKINESRYIESLQP